MAFIKMCLFAIINVDTNNVSIDHVSNMLVNLKVKHKKRNFMSVYMLELKEVTVFILVKGFLGEQKWS